jgi:GH35 family endo-1,4-beta-xylanase|tara:strand:- start:1279 stop:2433 length:1155 start_codon:yes stop_codon:yes gene_type:complete
MKNLLTKFLIVLLFISCSSDSEDSTIVTKDPDPIPVKITDPFKKLISEDYNTDTFKFGATLNFFQFNTNVETLFLKEFDYLVAENSFKQTIVHPEPNVWNWERADAFLDFANKNNLQLRVHGPIGPQSSNWAKTDSRTKDELIKNYEEFLTELCKKVNSEENVKWMDVVNETIDKEGKWTIEKTGTDYQNPWAQIGNNEDGIPLYIIRSFEIAKEYAPNVSLVFNQHQGMQPVMWDKVKETILYLKNKGLKIDGLGWQSHLRDNVIMSLNKENIDYLMSLIDWAHQNDLDFHVTEIDYKMTGDPPTSSEYERQANGYSNILKALIAKRDSGVVTFNTWGVYDKNEVSEHQYKYIYDSNLNPKKAVDLLKSTLKNKNTTPKYLDN